MMCNEPLAEADLSDITSEALCEPGTESSFWKFQRVLQAAGNSR